MLVPFQRFASFLLLVCCIGRLSHADESQAPVPRPPVFRVDDSVSALGSDQYPQRRRAFLELWKRGEEVLPAIRLAKTSSNLQTAQAATTLETLLMLDVSAESLGLDIVELILEPNREKAVLLCRRGYWELAEHLLRVHPQLSEGFTVPEVNYYLNQIVEAATSQGDPRLAWPIVRLATTPMSDQYEGSDLRVWLAEHLDLPLLPGREEDSEIRALQLAYRGQVAAALELDISDALRRKLTMRHGLWQSLSDPALQRSLLGELSSVSRRAAEAVLLEFSGDLASSDALWEQLLARAAVAAADKKESDQQSPLESAADRAALDLLNRLPAFETPWLLYALVLRGQVAPVEVYLAEANPRAALSFYVAGNDYASALKMAGLEPDLSNFESWLANHKTTFEQNVRRSGDLLFSDCAHVCNLLTGLGFRDQAWELLEMLAEVANRQTDLWTGSGSILGWMGRAEQRMFCLQIVEQHFHSLRADTQARLLQNLFPEFRNSALPLSQTAPRIADASGKPVSQLQLLEKLHLWDQQYFSEVASEAAIADWIQRTQRRLLNEQTAENQPGLYVRQLSELSQLALGCGLADLALEIGEIDVRDFGGPLEILQLQWMEAAKIHGLRGDPQRAADLLEKLRVLASPANNQPALVDEVRARLMAGDYENAMRLDQSRWLRPLGLDRLSQLPDYSQVVNYFVEQSDFSAAEEYAELAFRLSDYGSINAYWAASDLATILEEREDFQRCSDVRRAPLLEALHPASSMLPYLTRRDFHSSLRYATQQERLCRAVACIDRGDYAEAEHHMQIGKRLQPQDIELVVQCYPRLRDAGKMKLANRLFDAFEASMLQQIEQWPRDATTLNNLAWMYSQCDRKLVEAYSLATQAVELVPSSAVYLDTLAEVQYRAGRTELAIDTMLRCVRLAPRERHYRANLKRFEKGEK